MPNQTLETNRRPRFRSMGGEESDAPFTRRLVFPVAVAQLCVGRGVARMTKTLFFVALLVLVNGCQVYTMNMNKAPTRWVTVVDADTGAPVEGVALAYHDTRKPYFIVSTVVESRSYVAGPDGRAFVPRNVHLQTVWKSAYVIDSFCHPYPPAKNADVYYVSYVRTVESHMKLMGERLQRETNR